MAKHYLVFVCEGFLDKVNIQMGRLSKQVVPLSVDKSQPTPQRPEEIKRWGREEFALSLPVFSH
jgi:hypothetical protein